MRHFRGKTGRAVEIVAVISCLTRAAFAQEPGQVPAQVPDPRRAELEQLLRWFPRSEAWEEWLNKTGELPPDFEKMPSIPWLPDPLVLEVDGKTVAVRTADDWAKKRAEILAQFHHYVFGSVPPPPGNVRPRSVKEREEKGARAYDVDLEFGPEHRATLSLELFVPVGEGPFPVFLTQHTHRAWALQALSRGYAACVYAGADSKDDTAGFVEVWPEYDWTKLARRAFAASRAIDYLETLPLIDRTKIAMTGHSRNGKMSLMAAAMDERITAVISSSSGAGGACPYRLFSEAHFGEGIEFITRNFPDWLHPRLRFFAGREQKLPIDNHELIALSAPRACLIATALNDPVESVWAIQKAYVSAKRVYALLGHPEKVGVYWRFGTHGTRAETIETYLDWLDGHFERASFSLPERLIYPEAVKASMERQALLDSGLGAIHRGMDELLRGADGAVIETPEAWRERRAVILSRIDLVLGHAPAAAFNPGQDYGSEERYQAMLLMRPEAAKGVAKRSFNFGNYLAGDLYVPEEASRAGARLACVIWLHPSSCSNGYVAGYGRGDPVHIALARDGFAVFAYDQIGFGSRIAEVTRFYERYPEWTLLAKMIADARAAVDALSRQALVDPARIFVLGYGLGGMVALHAAALDERIAGAVSVAGFTPFRLDTEEKGTGGPRRHSDRYPLLPSLGRTANRARHDFHEVLASIAPRPVLVVAPTHDREATLPDVIACIQAAQGIYSLLGAREQLQTWTPDDYNRYPSEMQAEVNRRLKGMVSRSPR